eukprot:scaffold10264_cov66-Isochrysis_galbana.AAC.1
MPRGDLPWEHTSSERAVASAKAAAREDGSLLLGMPPEAAYAVQALLTPALTADGRVPRVQAEASENKNLDNKNLDNKNLDNKTPDNKTPDNKTPAATDGRVPRVQDKPPKNKTPGSETPQAGAADLPGEFCFVGAVDHDAVLSALRLAIGAHARRMGAIGLGRGGGERGRGSGTGGADDTDGGGSGGEADPVDTVGGGGGDAGLMDTAGWGGGEAGGGALLMDWEWQGLSWTASGAILDRQGHVLRSPGGRER